jgi:hypothetical protein
MWKTVIKPLQKRNIKETNTARAMNTKFTHNEGNIEERIVRQFGKGNPFTVPEHYFDELHDTIMAQIAAQPDRKPAAGAWKRIVIELRPMYIVAAAAVAILLVVSFFIPYMKTSGNQYEYDRNDGLGYANTEIETVIEGSRLDDYALYQLVADTD